LPAAALPMQSLRITAEWTKGAEARRPAESGAGCWSGGYLTRGLPEDENNASAGIVGAGKGILSSFRQVPGYGLCKAGTC